MGVETNKNRGENVFKTEEENDKRILSMENNVENGNREK
jgi:hypothetical protein